MDLQPLSQRQSQPEAVSPKAMTGIERHWAEQDYAAQCYLERFYAIWTAEDHAFLSEITKACSGAM